MWAWWLKVPGKSVQFPSYFAAGLPKEVTIGTCLANLFHVMDVTRRSCLEALRVRLPSPQHAQDAVRSCRTGRGRRPRL
jgi:hypothetical protein